MAAVLRPEVRVREMAGRDLDRVAAIEQDSYPFPWTRGIFADCIRVGYVCRVADVDGEVAGYLVLSAAAGEAHLLNLCVAPDWRRTGISRVLLEAALVEAGLREAQRLFLEVRPSNAAAIALYEGAGFRTIGRRPGYYPADDGREDARVMVRHLVREGERE
ncbi:MAG: ribosomal protein S18-alanine N-acetyltransferase [Wenzhouxiangellaceae bacterium]|nr:ribosomal protein S18-alanine N-acetyltransferase [Wenzhouxiangellaceae bacterium]